MDVMASRIRWTTTSRMKLLQAYMAVAEEIRTGMFSGDEWTEVAARTWKVDSAQAEKLRSSAIRQLYDLRLVYKRYLEGGSKPPRLKNDIIRKLKVLDRGSASPPTSPGSPSTSKETIISEKEKEKKEDSDSSASRFLHASQVHKDGEVDGSEQDEGVEMIKGELVSLRDWFEEEIVPLGTEIMKIVKAATVKHDANHNSALCQSNEMRYSCKLMFELDQERVDSIIKTKFIELKLHLLQSLQDISTGITEEFRKGLPKSNLRNLEI